MTVQEKINIELTLAMLNKEVAKRDLLRVVIGEFNRVDKTVSDEKALSIIKKMVENAKEQGNTGEVTILEQYLPTQNDPAHRDILRMVFVHQVDHLPFHL